jgi:hypothetical protein
VSRRLPGAGRERLRGGFRVTTRDKEIVRWIGRLRMANAAQVAERFRLGRAVTYARLSGLVHLGLLDHARIFHRAPGVYLATRRGLASVDLELPPGRVDLRTYTHDLELASLVVELECEYGPASVRTEREMRAAETSLDVTSVARQRFAVPLAGASGQLELTAARHRRLHFPDCAVIGAAAAGTDGVLAIELERTPKGRARLRRILRGYVAARHVSLVRYYVLGDRVRALVESEVAAQHAERLIEIRGWPRHGNYQVQRSTAA